VLQNTHRAVLAALLAVACVLLSVGQALASSFERGESASGPLKVIGRADCSAVAKHDDVVLAAVKVAGNHDVCVVEGSSKSAVYLDGRGGMTWPNGSSVWSSSAGILGRDRFLFFTTVDLAATVVQLRSCAGDRVKLKPISGASQRFAVAAVTRNFGHYYPVQLDSAGNPIPGASFANGICDKS
jgi:hypothetical protein